MNAPGYGSSYGCIHLCKILFGSINYFMSYQLDIVFPNSISKRGNNSTRIWWSVTKFKIDLPFKNMYIMYQISFRSINYLMSYHPENITFPNSKSKRGNNSDGILWSVTRLELDLSLKLLYMCAKFHLDLWILSGVIIPTLSFSSILSKKGAITLSEFGGVWPDSNLTFLLWVYTNVQSIIRRHFTQFWVKKGP